MLSLSANRDERLMRTQLDTAPLQVSAQPNETLAVELLIRLLEEMMDLKLQQQSQSYMKYPPEFAHLMQEKRETDRRRLDQIRAELIRLLHS